MYKEKGVEFLTDESDTVQAYEEKGRDSASNMSDEDSTATALAGMNRVQQIEVVRGKFAASAEQQAQSLFDHVTLNGCV